VGNSNLNNKDITITITILKCALLYSYLAVKSALMCEADYLFIREWPQKLEWPDKLCKNVQMVC